MEVNSAVRLLDATGDILREAEATPSSQRELRHIAQLLIDLVADGYKAEHGTHLTLKAATVLELCKAAYLP